MRLNQKRIQVLEEKAGIGAPTGPAVFLMWFGSEITGARHGGATWAREAGEALQDFESRLRRDVPQSESYCYRMIRYFGEPCSEAFNEGDIL